LLIRIDILDNAEFIVAGAERDYQRQCTPTQFCRALGR
jgi:hypothetical protein